MRPTRRAVAAASVVAALGCGADGGGAALGGEPDAESGGGSVGASSDTTDGGGSGTAPGRDTEAPGGEDSSSGAPVEPPIPEPWAWQLPPGFPEPWVPADNPMSVAKVELGRHLFYDTRLSIDGSYSCATCHRQELAFTDGLPRAEGVTGQLHPRGSMSLVNVAYASSLAWANPELLDLETHALGPMFGDSPVELGLVDGADALARIAADQTYDALFEAAFPDEPDPWRLGNLVKAIACFERTIISGRAPFDRWFFDGDESAVSDAAKRGWELFNFPGQCTYCHFSFDFTDSTYFASLPERTMPFHNTGLYNVDGQGGYPAENQGLFAHTGVASDMGRFKSPTLRNIVLTGPYMHDGSVATLDEVLDLYGAGGRAETPYLDVRMKTFELDDGQRADFIAFFESLTDEALLTDPALGDPW